MNTIKSTLRAYNKIMDGFVFCLHGSLQNLKKKHLHHHDIIHSFSCNLSIIIMPCMFSGGFAKKL